MAIPKRRVERDWRDDWDAAEWRAAWSFLWLCLGCAAQASADLRARRSFYEGWGRIGDYRNRLVASVNDIIATHGNIDDAFHNGNREPDLVERWRLLCSIRAEIRRCDRDLTELRATYRIRAFDEDDLESATYRKLLEQGVQPEDYAGWAHPDLAGDRDAVRATSERVLAQKPRAPTRRYYERSLAVCLDLFEDARAGCNVFVPRGEIFVDRHGRRYRSRWPTPMDLAREVGRLEELIERLTP